MYMCEPSWIYLTDEQWLMSVCCLKIKWIVWTQAGINMEWATVWVTLTRITTHTHTNTHTFGLKRSTLPVQMHVIRPPNAADKFSTWLWKRLRDDVGEFVFPRFHTVQVAHIEAQPLTAICLGCMDIPAQLRLKRPDVDKGSFFFFFFFLLQQLYSSALVVSRSPLRSCILAIRGQHTLPINKYLTVFNKGLHRAGGAAPSAPALSISALPSHHPISSAAPNFVFISFNSVFFSSDTGRWRREKGTTHRPLKVSAKRSTTFKKKSLLCFLETQSAQFPFYHIRRNREDDGLLRQWVPLINAVYLKLD